MEIWKDISGFEGLYQVSSLGRFKRLKTVCKRKNGINMVLQESIIKTTYNSWKGGFLIVQLFKDGCRTTRRASRIVAEHFLPPPTDKLLRPVVGFKDGNRRNISASNLMWLEADNYDTNDGLPVPGVNNMYVTRNGVVYRIIDGVEKVLRGNRHPEGYIYVGITEGGIAHNFKVHRLVAELFVDRPDESYNQVDHIDGNRSNNNYKNLRWCTNTMNQQYRHRTLPLVPYIKYYISKGLTNNEIANMFGVRRLVVNRIRNNKTYQNIKMEKPNDAG